MADEITTTTTTTAPPAWHAGLDADHVAHVTGRGWDKLEPAAVALEAVKAHRAAEKLIGVPAENILRKPKDAADADNWNKLYETIGVPADAKDYDFSDVKKADGSALDEKTVEAVRALAASVKVSKDGAKALARDYQKAVEAADTNQTAEYTAKLAAEQETLKTNWGATNHAANMIVAQNGAAKLGVTGEEVKALEKTVGYARTMEMFRKVGVGLGEDAFVSNNGQPQNGPLTVEQAQAELDMLKADSVWVKKYESGDAEAARRFQTLTQLIAAAKR